MPTHFAIGAEHWSGLSKLVEEAGEVTQVAGKLMGSFGDPNHFDGSDLRVSLREEIADLEAALAFFKSANFSSREQIDMAERTREKRSLFNMWHHDTRQPWNHCDRCNYGNHLCHFCGDTTDHASGDVCIPCLKEAEGL